MRFREIQRVNSRLAAALRTRPMPRESGPAPRVTPAAPVMCESIVELHCVCGVTDRAYVLQYAPAAGGKLRYLSSQKLDGAIPPRRDNSSATISAAQEMRFDAFETRRFPCPWCGDASINACGSCGSLVCGGRKRGKQFVCRASCGATWIGVPLERVAVSTRRMPAPECTASPAPAGHALVLVPRAGLVKR